MSIDLQLESKPTLSNPLNAMNVIAPRICREAVSEAYTEALDRSEPIFHPVGMYADDRGWSFMNQLQGVLNSTGQINYSVQYPGVIKAWHRHQFQTDFWMGLMGNLKVGVHCEETGRSWVTVIGERRPGVLIIPPSLWHGATAVGAQQAGLLYYVTHAYDPTQPDEERRDVESLPGFPWAVQNR